jgi:hypothetical protein
VLKILAWLDDTDRGADPMTDSSSINRIGLPEQILYALTPRPMPVEGVVDKPRRTPTTAREPEAKAEHPGAVFTPSDHESAVNGDEHLLTELRMLAELHAAHQAAGSSSQAA